MPQVFSVNGNYIALNGQNVLYAVFVTAIAVSNDLQALYLASSVANYISKYKNTEQGWVQDTAFKVDWTALFPSGLLLDDTDLYISFADNNNNSQIMKVDAGTGNQYYVADTGKNLSTIYTSIAEGLSAMVTDGAYLYVANTGNYNAGRSIDRIDLADNTVNTEEWQATGLAQAPIQLCIFQNYLCVLQSAWSFADNQDKRVVLLDLAKGTVAFTLPLLNSVNVNLGLSLVNSTLNVIDNNVVIKYAIDLSVVTPTVTVVV